MRNIECAIELWESLAGAVNGNSFHDELVTVSSAIRTMGMGRLVGRVTPCAPLTGKGPGDRRARILPTNLTK